MSEDVNLSVADGDHTVDIQTGDSLWPDGKTRPSPEPPGECPECGAFACGSFYVGDEVWARCLNCLHRWEVD